MSIQNHVQCIYISKQIIIITNSVLGLPESCLRKSYLLVFTKSNTCYFPFYHVNRCWMLMLYTNVKMISVWLINCFVQNVEKLYYKIIVLFVFDTDTCYVLLLFRFGMNILYTSIYLEIRWNNKRFLLYLEKKSFNK